jgi:hypothetical protein
MEKKMRAIENESLKPSNNCVKMHQKQNFQHGGDDSEDHDANKNGNEKKEQAAKENSLEPYSVPFCKTPG